jgi:hypothetical protein
VKGKSSLLVGYIQEGNRFGMLQKAKPWREAIELYDFGVVCPPPPSCGCEIAQ